MTAGSLHAVDVQEPADGSAAGRAFLDQYCLTCHNSRLRTAGLALDGKDVANVPAAAEVWEKVVRRLRAGAMPPPGARKPHQAASDAFVSYLERSLDLASAARPNPGRTEALHRLNRAEYQNAIRDLLALDVDAASLLPADAADQHGFDNIASVLSISPALLERYVSAARKISRLAVGLPPQPTIDTYDVPLTLSQEDLMSEDLPFGSRGGAAIRHNFAVDGEYAFRIRLQTNYVGYIRGLDRPHLVQLRIDGAQIRQFSVGGEAKGGPAPYSYEGNIVGDPAWERYMQHADEALQLRVPLRAGVHVVGVSFLREQWEREGILQPRQFGFPLAVNAVPDGNPGLGSLEIAGPYNVSGPGDSPSRRRIFVCRPERRSEEERCARRILSELVQRAYRHPASSADLQLLMRFYRAGRAEASFDDGIQAALERLLAGPDFLFRIERDPARLAAGTAYQISDLELASRLSFFLWSSIPDDPLLDVARRGKLREPAMLEEQVRRMLRDPRSNALTENFAGQWLYLRNMRTAHPDPETFPEFDDSLREALQRETELFVDSQIHGDRSVPELLSANYTFLNERLARHYGIPNVYGSRFRRVTLSNTDQRGGLLGHGSLLTVTSYPNRTSPVLRGKWLLENILGTPPPPPPPNVPALPERGDGGKPASVRDRLELHRKSPACSVCHSQMDPLGFALENFNAIGAWRLTGEAGTPIDSSGTLSTGVKFEGVAGLRTVLLNRREEFVRTVSEKLLTYALGRRLEYYDMPAVRAIARDAARDDYRWSALTIGIAKSAPFQMRTVEPDNSNERISQP
jgi:hypothetical protein